MTNTNPRLNHFKAQLDRIRPNPKPAPECDPVEMIEDAAASRGMDLAALLGDAAAGCGTDIGGFFDLSAEVQRLTEDSIDLVEWVDAIACGRCGGCRGSGRSLPGPDRRQLSEALVDYLCNHAVLVGRVDRHLPTVFSPAAIDLMADTFGRVDLSALAPLTRALAQLHAQGTTDATWAAFKAAGIDPIIAHTTCNCPPT